MQSLVHIRSSWHRIYTLQSDLRKAFPHTHNTRYVLHVEREVPTLMSNIPSASGPVQPTHICPVTVDTHTHAHFDNTHGHQNPYIAVPVHDIMA